MNINKLRRLRFFYIFAILILVISAFVVPYTIISSLNIFYGAFLFWSIFSLMVIFLTIKITSYWRNN